MAVEQHEYGSSKELAEFTAFYRDQFSCCRKAHTTQNESECVMPPTGQIHVVEQLKEGMSQGNFALCAFKKTEDFTAAGIKQEAVRGQDMKA